MLTLFLLKKLLFPELIFGILKNNSTFNAQYPNYDNQKFKLAYRTTSTQTLVHNFFQTTVYRVNQYPKPKQPVGVYESFNEKNRPRTHQLIR